MGRDHQATQLAESVAATAREADRISADGVAAVQNATVGMTNIREKVESIADQILAPKYGYPLKLRVPTKLGFKNLKLIAAIFVTNEYPGGYWEDKGYNWFSGS